MKIPNSCILAVLISLSVAINPAFVFSENVDKVDHTMLLDKAKAMGTVRIIIHLTTVSFQPEGLLSLVQDVQAQQSQISQAQVDILNRLAGHNISNVKKFATIPYMAMEVDAIALEALSIDPGISDIEEDIPVPPTLNQSIPFINADDVHQQGYNGDGFAVAVLDTGVRKTHVFLDFGKVVSEACYSSNYSPHNATSVCPNGLESQTGSGSGVNCSTTIDGCSHGTHVAGIAAGTGGAPGTGVAPAANVIAIQVFSRFDSAAQCGSSPVPCVLSYTSDQLLGLERVYALRTTYAIAAANMSIGGGQYSSFCDSDSRKAIIDNLRSANIATVISSGNNGWDGYVGSPGCISSAITVGATLNNTDTVASYSNHATMVDLLAPGSDIYSSTATSNTSYDSWNGTSMAAPHVTGAFAVMRDINNAWTVSEIETLLETNGANVTRSGVTKPRIDLLAASSTSPTLGEAVDNVSLIWTTGGNADWLAQTITTYYGGDAAQSGDISDSQTSYMQTAIYRAGTISFYWKVSSESSYDYLRFYVDGVEQAGSISGSTNWAQKIFAISGTGAHILKWAFTKDGIVSSGSDCGWVDRVVWTPSSSPPSSSNPWPMFLAAIIVGESKPQPNPQWGAGLDVCCPSSSTTFYLTSSGVTKKSIATNCSTASTWEGWVPTTPGTKSFSWNLVASGCGSLTGSFSYALSNGKSYYFQMELDGSSNLVISVYVSTISSTASANTETYQGNVKTVDNIQASMQLVETIQLNIPEGEFIGNSCKIDN